MTLFALVFAHCLADYPLQGDFLSKMKGQRLLLMLAHCTIWTGCITVTAQLCGMQVRPEDIGLLFAVHLAADQFKARGLYGKADPLGWPLTVDQGIHLLQIIVLIWERGGSLR